MGGVGQQRVLAREMVDWKEEERKKRRQQVFPWGAEGRRGRILQLVGGEEKWVLGKRRREEEEEKNGREENLV
ncbi:unnamed protein product [Gadus morhua 'NCC']